MDWTDPRDDPNTGPLAPAPQPWYRDPAALFVLIPALAALGLALVSR